MLCLLPRKSVRFLFGSVALYALCVAVAVVFACREKQLPMDPGLTVSVYVGFYPWTSVLFAAAISAIAVFICLHLPKIQMKPAQKLLYILIVLCVLGCGWLPCNSDRSRLITDLHNRIAEVLIPALMLSFGFMAVFARNVCQRIFGLLSSAFSIFCLTGLIFRIEFFDNTLFIWENLLILLFLAEFSLETAVPRVPEKSLTQEGA